MESIASDQIRMAPLRAEPFPDEKTTQCSEMDCETSREVDNSTVDLPQRHSKAQLAAIMTMLYVSLLLVNFNVIESH